jgi:hypothetical protein
MNHVGRSQGDATEDPVVPMESYASWNQENHRIKGLSRGLATRLRAHTHQAAKSSVAVRTRVSQPHFLSMRCQVSRLKTQHKRRWLMSSACCERKAQEGSLARPCLCRRSLVQRRTCHGRQARGRICAPAVPSSSIALWLPATLSGSQTSPRTLTWQRIPRSCSISKPLNLPGRSEQPRR